jgi:hypothetical protein
MPTDSSMSIPGIGLASRIFQTDLFLEFGVIFPYDTSLFV